MASKTRKSRDLSLSQRIEIVKLLEEKKLSQVELAKRFDCSQSTISKIAKNKPAILREAEEYRVGDRKHKRSGKDEDIEKALYTCFVDARSRDPPITNTVLEEKATHFATLLNKQDFKATNGWLCRWKARNGIKFKKSHGEKKDANICAAETWSTTNFLKNTPLATCTTLMRRESITTLCQMELSPFLLTSLVGARGRRNVQLPYAHSSNAWMTGTIFRRWHVEFNKDMVKEDRRIALLVDNCSAHPKDTIFHIYSSSHVTWESLGL